ncbi:MAG: GNAT family N-acetyltransferase [Thermomicrobiales bacterium]
MTSPIDVRLLTAPEVHIALDWARREGWNPGPYDAASFFAADPEGFWASFHDGEPAAVVSVVRYGTSFGFLGLYICRPELRGMGYGKRVWDAALAASGDRVIGLDGVPAQQDNYRRSGFALAWRNRRYQGLGKTGPVAPDVVDLDTIPFADIAAYDAATFEADRGRFLRVWIAQPDAVRLGIMRDGALVGWGLLRPCAEGYKIGPLMADDASVAERLLDALLAAVPGEPVFLDVPEPNAAAVRMAEAHGMAVSFETARMYRGVAPAIALDTVWGITTFELG